jgi:uncharacterized protein (DUF58 family)
LLRSIQLTQRFFVVMGVIIVSYALSFPFQLFEPIAFIALVLLAVLVLTELVLLLPMHSKLKAARTTSKMFSLGDENNVKISIRNESALNLQVSLFDELPFQFQLRNFEVKLVLASEKAHYFTYQLKPHERGEYHFGNLNAIVTTIIGLGGTTHPVSRAYHGAGLSEYHSNEKI